MRCIRQAQARAKTVVVALDSDRKINDSKGVGRPVMCFSERAAALGFLDVHFVVEITAEEDMRLLIAGLKPDFRIQGEDHLEHDSRFKIPKFFVHRPKKSLSTSEIIRRCKLVKL
jgi:bifunctional ADP-heptose synthase (sugar kinase/adenylyltransferase)